MPVQQHGSSLAMELGVCAAMSLEPAQQHRRSVSSSLATELGVCAGLSRLDPSGGGVAVPVLPSTLLDEYERLAIEAQLSRAVLRRSYSEPSPSRVVALVREETAARGVEEGAGRAPCEPRARRPWLLEALKRVLCWLGGAWGGHGRSEERQAMPMPPAPPAPEPPRMRLLDYLR